MKRPSTDLLGSSPWEVGHVERGRRYRVIQAFQDADGDNHPIGEEWKLISTGFNKFDNELDLRIRDKSEIDWIIPLGWDTDRQQDVLEDWSKFVSAV